MMVKAVVVFCVDALCWFFVVLVLGGGWLARRSITVYYSQERCATRDDLVDLCDHVVRHPPAADRLPAAVSVAAAPAPAQVPAVAIAMPIALIISLASGLIIPQ